MKQKALTAITLIFAVCILLASGCTTAPAAETPAVSIENTEVQHADVNGISLAYREFGTENTKPVLMLTGFGQTMEDWNMTFIAGLSEKYHVYIYDHRGMGMSTDVDAQFTIPQLADDAAGLITALGYENMNIYGVSMGSTVSQQILINHPEKVRKAVLSSASYSACIPETEKLHGILEESAQDPDLPAGVRKEAVANLEYEGSYDSLSGITNDVMLITGTADDITPVPVALEIAGQIEGSWFVSFKGIPHVGSKYAPEEYAGVVTTFLETDESPV